MPEDEIAYWDNTGLDEDDVDLYWDDAESYDMLDTDDDNGMPTEWEIAGPLYWD